MKGTHIVRQFGMPHGLATQQRPVKGRPLWLRCNFGSPSTPTGAPARATLTPTQYCCAVTGSLWRSVICGSLAGRCRGATDSHTTLCCCHLNHVALSCLQLACRTLLYGGVAMNPRSHLRLVYEANPLAFLAEQARTSRRPAHGTHFLLVPGWLHWHCELHL